MDLRCGAIALCIGRPVCVRITSGGPKPLTHSTLLIKSHPVISETASMRNVLTLKFPKKILYRVSKTCSKKQVLKDWMKLQLVCHVGLKLCNLGKIHKAT